MTESITDELARLEAAGRVRASDQRPVHREFGFAALAKSPLQQPPAPQPQFAPPAPQPAMAIAAELDDAWSRLKNRIEPS